MNNINLIGRLTRDIEIRQIGDDKIVGNTALAASIGKDKTLFIDLEIWGKTAQLVADYSGKGKQIGVTGSLRQDSWEKDGEKRSKHLIVVNSIDLLDSSSSSSDADEEVAEPVAKKSVPKKSNPFEDE